MVVKQAIPGKYFDVDSILSTAEAAEFLKAGFLGVVRYLPRTPQLVAGNLTPGEMSDILSSGLSISVVQHVSEDNWNPTAALGTEYGQYVARYAAAIGLPKGMHIWLDLEMVNTSATVQDVKDYCQNWFNEVQAAGYLAALYVGWQVILNSTQLYDLPFKAYWRGYNADIPVATRGYMITQHPQQTLNGINFDPDTIALDDIGDLPMLLYPS
jgi:hypothetical protein